jgi:hypothetical protein
VLRRTPTVMLWTIHGCEYVSAEEHSVCESANRSECDALLLFAMISWTSW